MLSLKECQNIINKYINEISLPGFLQIYMIPYGICLNLEGKESGLHWC